MDRSQAHGLTPSGVHYGSPPPIEGDYIGVRFKTFPITDYSLRKFVVLPTRDPSSPSPTIYAAPPRLRFLDVYCTRDRGILAAHKA